MMKISEKFPRLLWFSSIIAALGGLLFGFDMAVVSGILPLVTDQFDLNATQQGWLVSSALLGCILGVAVSGRLGDRYGRRAALRLTAVLFFLSTLGCAFSSSMPIMIIFRIMGGIGVGLASSLVPLYLSEIAPASIRGRLVTYYQLAVTLGILLAYLSNAYLLQGSFDRLLAIFPWMNQLFVGEVWRGMFLMGALPSLLFLVGLFGIPESPRWLIQQGRDDQGTKLFERITGTILSVSAEAKKQDKKAPAFTQLFSPRLRKPMLLGLLLPLFSQFCGINAIIYYGPSILQETGMSLENSLHSQIVFGLANMLFTFIAIWTVDRLGRRPLYLYGTMAAGCSLLVLGICFYGDAINAPLVLLAVVVFLASFAFSLGPLKFVVASEIFPADIRSQAMAMSIMVMWISDLIVGQLTPMMLDRWGVGITFWFFGVFCILAFLTVYRLLPETKGLTLEQIEQKWLSDTTKR